MKINNGIKIAFLVCFAIFAGCKKDNPETQLYTPVSLTGPADHAEIQLDIFGTTQTVTLKWTALPDAGADVTYKVLFDIEGTKFETPVDSLVSNNAGKATELVLTHLQLDAIAAKAGIAAKKSGTIRWAVDAKNGSKIITSVASSLLLKRPTGLGALPAQLFLTGSATEGGASIETAIPFKKVKTGVYELLTSLKNGSYKIVSDKSVNAITYYILDKELFRGDQEMQFVSAVKPVIIKIDFNNTLGATKTITSADVIVTASGATIATLDYKGNHIFEKSNIVFSFLSPGSPGAPSWLGWVEERYKFRFKTNDGDEYFGSPYDAGMGASSDPNVAVFNGRPDGAEPQGYFNVYNVDPNDYWAGCYKFASQFDGSPMKIKIDFNPARYVHSVTVN